MKWQKRNDLIHRYFKTTTEPYDELEWDGRILRVWFNGAIVEVYGYADLAELIRDF